MATALGSPRDGFNTSLAPGFPNVVGEYLQIPGAVTPNTPRGLDTAAFLRLRDASDREHPKPANAIVIAMPDSGDTPSQWLTLGAQLVSKASARACYRDGKESMCRIEVWIVQRRGANLADTQGARAARAKRNPVLAIDYYFGRSVLNADASRPGKWPLLSPHALIGKGESKWRPLQQADVPFLADWGFETHAADIDRMLASIKQQAGGKNIFLAGHAQGGDFVTNYAGRRQAGKRGYEKVSGLIFLGNGPSLGALQAPTPTQAAEYSNRIATLRKGQANVFFDESGRGNQFGASAGPAAAAAAIVVNAHYALMSPDAESIFALPAIRHTYASPAGDDFLAALRLTYRAHAGMSFDADPLPGRGQLQTPIVSQWGAGLGQLDFAPLPGNEQRCDPLGAIEKPACVPSLAQLDRNRIYKWIEGGETQEGANAANKVGKAQLRLNSQSYAPSRSNIRAITHAFAASGGKTIDASNMAASGWYAPERYDCDLNFLNRFKTAKIAAHHIGVDVDIDKSALINIPVYVAAQNATPGVHNPFPLVTDFTEINRTGTYQTAAARDAGPIDAKIHTRWYRHADFTSADDSLNSRVPPGEPGSSAVANTLIEWLLARSAGAARVPTPSELGVVATY